MSASQDTDMTTAGADTTSTSQDIRGPAAPQASGDDSIPRASNDEATTGSTSKYAYSAKGLSVGDVGAAFDPFSTPQTALPPSAPEQDPDDPIGNPNPLPFGYSIEGNPEPGEYDHLDMFEGLNLHQNMESAFKTSFEDMISDFAKGDDEAAESMAAELLLWGNLPVLYRAYAHIVLAYGPLNGLYHACKAVEDAQWGVQNFGDQSVGIKLLAVAKQTLQEVLDSGAANITKETTAAKQKEVHAASSEVKVLDEEDEMILDSFEGDLRAARAQAEAAKQQEREDDVLGIQDEMLFDNFNEIPEVQDAVMDNAEAVMAEGAASASSVSGTVLTKTTSTTKLTEASSKATDMTSISSQAGDEHDAGSKKRDHSDGSQDEQQEPIKKKKESKQSDDK